MYSSKVHKFFTAVAMIIFAYQIIDMSIKYCKFSILIEFTTQVRRYQPVVSVCVNNKNELKRLDKTISGNKTIWQLLCSNIQTTIYGQPLHCFSSLVNSITPSRK